MAGNFEIVKYGKYARDRIVTSWGEFDKTRTDLASQTECRLADWKSVGEMLLLGLAPARRGPQFDGLGVCSVVRSADDLLLVQKRTKSQRRYPGWYHVCGGILERDPQDAEVHVDPFGWMQFEMDEELYINPESIEDMYSLGIVKDLNNMRPELVFATHLSVPAEVARQSGPEHSKLLKVDDSPPSLLRFVLERKLEIVPSGLACLLLYGRHRFGELWFAYALAEVVR
jgi:hypothetical protein